MKFPKLVIDEAKALKEQATKEEKNSLDFETLNPSDVQKEFIALNEGRYLQPEKT